MFSPSPFPQSRRPGRHGSARPGFASPPRRSQATGSRLTTPARSTSGRHSDAPAVDVSMEAEDVADEMSVEEETTRNRTPSGRFRAPGAVFALSEELTVSLDAQLPVEVQQALKATGA